MIERYLYYFVLITKHGTYIDAFAGPQSPDTPDSWAAKLVLENEPRRLRNFFLCDSEVDQVRRLRDLRRAQPRVPGRRVRVQLGDANASIRQLLRERVIGEREATFCLLDQRTFECHWSTVRALSTYKKSGYKIEQFYFLANAWIDRSLATVGARNARAWWGRDDWQQLQGMSSWERARLVAHRFRDELAYAFAVPWAIYNREDGGRIMYFMIHATDHPRASDLMNRAYHQAVQPKELVPQLELAFGLPSSKRGAA